MTPKQICTGCKKLKKIVLSYTATIEVNNQAVTTDVRLCRDCLLKDAKKTPQK